MVAYGYSDWEENLRNKKAELDKVQRRARLKPAKQRANQKQAKVWARKVARKGDKCSK